MVDQHLGRGDLVAHFRVIEELGSGGAAIVYRVEDLERGGQRALKMLRDSALSDDNIQQRFVREVTVMQKLQHENLVRFDEAGLHDDSLYYVMELVDSGTLKDVLRRPLSWRDTVEVGLQLAEGLAALHDGGIIHRDIKPGNIYLSSSGLIKIGDFGLARDLSKSPLTMEGMTVGTVLYMAPEQVVGHQTTPSADLYALGCLFFQMLTSHPPFNGRSPMEVCEHHLHTPPPNPKDLGIHCPHELVLLIQRLMSKRAGDRPRGARELAEALQCIAASEPRDVPGLSPDTLQRIGDNRPRATAGSSYRAPPSAERNIDAHELAPNLVERLQLSQVEPRSTPSWMALAVILAGILLLLVLSAVFQVGS